MPTDGMRRTRFRPSASLLSTEAGSTLSRQSPAQNRIVPVSISMVQWPRCMFRRTPCHNHDPDTTEARARSPSAMGDDEQELIATAKQGDVASFNQLVHRYETRVFNLCYRMLADPDIAADAAQDTFLSAFRHIHTFRGGSFRSWLLRIATNTCYDVLRARKRRPLLSLDQSNDSEEARADREPVDPRESPDETVLRRELAHAIQDALSCLPDDQRLVVILCDIQGMSYQEIATITNQNLGTVKSRLSRGRARLRVLLRERELLPTRYRHKDESDIDHF